MFVSHELITSKEHFFLIQFSAIIKKSFQVTISAKLRNVMRMVYNYQLGATILLKRTISTLGKIYTE